MRCRSARGTGLPLEGRQLRPRQRDLLGPRPRPDRLEARGGGSGLRGGQPVLTLDLIERLLGDDPPSKEAPLAGGHALGALEGRARAEGLLPRRLHERALLTRLVEPERSAGRLDLPLQRSQLERGLPRGEGPHRVPGRHGARRGGGAEMETVRRRRARARRRRWPRRRPSGSPGASRRRPPRHRGRRPTPAPGARAPAPPRGPAAPPAAGSGEPVRPRRWPAGRGSARAAASQG